MNEFTLMEAIAGGLRTFCRSGSMALSFCLLMVVDAAAKDIEFSGVVYRTHVAEPGQIELYWLDPAGKPFRQLRKLQDHLKTQPGNVRCLMNAGIFEPDGIPSGLAVVDSKVLRPLNTADGRGNFFLKPTGVFYIDAQGAHIVTTEEYAALKPSPRIAIQSGPLLLRNARMHPQFRAGSTSRLHRNGVGIRADGSVLFAITEFSQTHFPNLYEFASFFRAQGCANALFLDGDISQMEIDPRAPLPLGNHFGAILAVITEKAPAPKPAPVPPGPLPQ
jgi:uncharacterized protein YigE (DUF2233 family)